MPPQRLKTHSYYSTGHVRWTNLVGGEGDVKNYTSTWTPLSGPAVSGYFSSRVKFSSNRSLYSEHPGTTMVIYVVGIVEQIELIVPSSFRHMHSMELHIHTSKAFSEVPANKKNCWRDYDCCVQTTEQSYTSWSLGHGEHEELFQLSES